MQLSKSKRRKLETEAYPHRYQTICQAKPERDADDAFGRIVAHWVKCAPKEVQEDLKLGIHVMCYHAIKHGSVPSFDLSLDAF